MDTNKKIDRWPTIITMIYDIRKLESEANTDLTESTECGDPTKFKVRLINKYLNLGAEFILKLPYNIIIFVDPNDTEIVDFIALHRQQFINKTTIYKLPLSETYFYRYVTRLKELQTIYPIYNRNIEKDTPHYIIINNNKFDFIDKSIQINPYKSTHFIWMDFGINHVAREPHKIHDWILQIPNKIKQLCINPYSDNCVEDKDKFHNIYHHMAGGLISGDINHLSQYITLFKAKTEQIYNDNWYQIDEAVMTMVHKENYDLFDLYYGDYEGIIANYLEPVYSAYLIIKGVNKTTIDSKKIWSSHILNYLAPYFKNESTQNSESFPLVLDYIAKHLINDYYTNSGYLHTNAITIINKMIIKGDAKLCELLKIQQQNISFYKNKNLILQQLSI